MENHRIPSIRFKGFSDAWEQRKAKELCSITTGKSNTQDQSDEGIYPFFIRSDIPVKSKKYLYDQEAVITIGDGNIGKVFHYVNGKFDLHQRCYKMADFKHISAKYFYWYFSTKFYKRAISMTAKATVDSVRLEMISEMDIKYPCSSREQNLIQSFLFNIDNLITLHQRKCQVLINTKKALLEKMFPSEHEAMPKIRFKGFSDAWEQRKLGDIANILTGGEAPEDTIKSDQPDGDYKYPVLSNGLGENALWGYAKTYRVKAPAITFSSIGTLGYPELRNTDFTPIIRLKVIIPKNNNLNISFLKNSISLADFSNNASGIPNINAESVKSISLKISLNQTEQEHIGNLFDNLDHLITLHQRKCEKLKNMKKSLLEKMFI